MLPSFAANPDDTDVETATVVVNILNSTAPVDHQQRSGIRSWLKQAQDADGSLNKRWAQNIPAAVSADSDELNLTIFSPKNR